MTRIKGKIFLSHPTDLDRYGDDTTDETIVAVRYRAEEWLERRGWIVERLPDSVEGYFELVADNLRHDSRWDTAEGWTRDLIGDAYGYALDWDYPEEGEA